VSRGSATSEWLRANVAGRNLSDTVYVTANPQLERHREDWDVQFHEIVNVWLDEGWDEETGTVRAETLTDAAIEAIERFPDKRILVHYMQPHYPFVPSESEVDKQHLRTITNSDDHATGENVWNMKFTGRLPMSDEEIWSMYVDNLEYVLKSVNELLAHLSGKTVITSDHGNYVGERAWPIPIREYGHPRGIYDEPLVTIPWLEVNTGERRTIRQGNGGSQETKVDTAEIKQRLRDLGYRE
jgi:hypothetical protein